MRNRLIGSIDHHVILDEVIGPETKEVHTRSHQIAGLRRGRRLDHDADGNPRIVRLAVKSQLLSHFGNNLKRRVQIIDAGNERQENTRGAVNGSAVETPQLLLKQIRIFQTEAQAADPEIHVHAIPALLIDAHINSAECDWSALCGLQYQRVVAHQ